MQFKKGYIYHIYNRGNNQGRIFFTRENYLYFLNKIRNQLLPYCSILAWCLMPKDFHLIIYVHHLKVENRKQSINGSYGKMLSSYARAIQNQENKTGSIFQKHTKFICLNDEKPKNYSNWKNEFGNSITLIDKTKSYPQICFDYIHLLPIHSQNISSPDEWEFSSYRDYQGLRNGKLVNFKLAEKELGIKRKVLD